MKLGLNLQTALQQTLTPQQIQYLKMLQLTAQQLEQHVRTELETNPMLEDGQQGDDGPDRDAATPDEPTQAERDAFELIPRDAFEQAASDGAPTLPPPESGGTEPVRDEAFDPNDAFEFYKLIWGEDPSAARAGDGGGDEEEEGEGFQIRDTPSFMEDLLDQIRFLEITDEERLMADYIVGNVDDDGYLRRDLGELLEEMNAVIAEHNLALHAPSIWGAAASTMQAAILPGISRALDALTLADAAAVLRRVQALDPPGVGSRTVQECLVAQLRALPRVNAAQKLALEVLTKTYDAFAMKHYHVIEKQLGVTSDYLREAIDVIRRLNPRPGGGTFGPESNTVVPDFIVEPDAEADDFLITVNDSRLPTLRVNSAYERLRRDARYRQFNKETKEWLRRKFEDAKFLIQAIRQRKTTMLKIMTAIVGLQKDFFRHGPEQLRPLIYRDVSEVTGMDISTVCRIVNGKYVLTPFGTFELKYFFSESLTMDDGEEVSTRIIKQKIKEMIDAEPKHKPLSDDKLTQDLKKLGYNVARRTVAKYREQLRIPVARLRREL